jgi:hypothetical protein
MNTSFRALLAANLIALLSVLTPALAGAADQPWVTQSNQNTKVLLNVLAKYSPESASQIGVDGYDEQIVDLSRDDFELTNKDLRAAMADYQKRLQAETDPRIRQDLEILIGAVQNKLTQGALDHKYFLPFIDATGLVYGVALQMLDPRIPKERQQTFLVRLAKYTGSAPDYRPVTELAKQRLLERVNETPKLLGPYKGEVEQALNSAPALITGIKDLLVKSGLQGWEANYALLEQQLADYNAWVRATVLPLSRADHRLPPEVYADNLHNFGVDIPPEELISRALTSYAELKNQIAITAAQVAKEKGFADPEFHAVIKRLKAQQIAKDEVMPLYSKRLAEIEDIVRTNHIVTLPERKAVIRLATDAENAQLPAPHMNPPRLIGNTGEYGEFVLTTGAAPDASGKTLVIDDFTQQAATWMLTAHEARPGHELQFAKMIEAGVSQARAVFAFNSVNVEGWGLYAEAEMQPYEPLDAQLMTIQSRMFRAARAFLDPMVNLGQITPEQVTSFLVDEVGFSAGLSQQETQRYTFRAPGQATSYFYGYQRLMETREATEVKLRGKFNRQAFNDFVLSQGLVPPRLLRKAVMEEFVPAQNGK